MARKKGKFRMEKRHATQNYRHHKQKQSTARKHLLRKRHTKGRK